MPELKAISVNRQRIPLRAADLWIHRNLPGTETLLPKPVRLAVIGGIAVYPAAAAAAPRLPLLGLRGLVRNGLRMRIEGRAMWVSLDSPAP